MLYYNCSKGENKEVKVKGLEKISKKFKKSLDKRNKLWYNKYIR